MPSLLLLPFIANHFPSLLGWAAGQAAKILVGEKAKSYLKARGQTKAYETALKRALQEFGKGHPDLVASFFDAHFLQATVSDEMLSLLTRDGQPNVQKIVSSYEHQFHGRSFGELPAAVTEFLDIVERQFKRESALQDLLTARQSDENNRILRQIHGAWSEERRPITTAGLSISKTTDLESLRAIFTAASREVLDWPQLLDGKRWLERPELAELLDRIRTTEQSVSLLLGPPGSGKSALLAKLAETVISEGWIVLAIKADQLPEDVGSLEALRDHLGLPDSMQQCVFAAAGHAKVVVILDQLDALSELVDLKTERLRVLLRVIGEFRHTKNVHIVASCRSFDRSYDARLSSIEADEWLLELPEWPAVQDVLKEHGIEAAQWPTLFRELLRTPQCLKFFLRHFSGTSERRVFESYQAMLEHLWTSRLLTGAAARDTPDLLHDVATEMAEREVMFVPAARFDSRRQALDHAVQSGILQYDPTRRQLSFTHQTIFDFARARAFIAKEQSLFRYVIERQTGLFVRPKLWSALHYLRGSDFKAYESELLTIWNAPTLRAHIRILLIDFIGMQEEPSSTEAALLRQLFEGSEYTAQVFSAVAGRKSWFDLLDQGHLARAMRSSELAWPANRVLEMSWNFAQERVLELLRTVWLPSPDKHTPLWQCLRNLRHWDRPALEIALRVVEAGDIHNSAVHDLATIVSSAQPDLATELIGTHFRKQVTTALVDREVPREAATDSSDAQALSELMRRQNKDQLRGIIDGDTDWYDLPAVAEAAPKSYFEHAWPPVRFVIETIASESGGMACTYEPDYILATHMEVDEERRGREYPVMDSFVFAIRELARQDLQGLRDLVEANEGSKSLTVHRLLCLGLRAAAEKDPEFCMQYLLRDVRRLSLGNFHEDERETKLLLRALIPQLKPSQIETLEDFVLGANAYAGSALGQDAKGRRTLAKYNRQFQLRLLLQFPPDALSHTTKALIASEMRAFPEFKDERREVEAHWSRSAMRADAMQKASVETITSFLAAFPDSSEWGDVFKSNGGSVEASREFAAFAKMDPAKALTVIRTLHPADQERPAAYAIREWSRAELPDSDLVELVLFLDGKGFCGDDFRECCADAFRKRIEVPNGLPDVVIDLLLRWLEERKLDADLADVGNRHSEESKEKAGSILWGMGGIRVLPNGSYQLLNAAFFGLLARSPVPSHRVLQTLREHLRRKDRMEVWEALAGEALTRLRHCDHADSALFLTELFDTYPSLLATHAAAVLLAHSFSWAPAEFTQSWLTRLGSSGSPAAGQSYGELLVLRQTFLKDSWSERAIQDVIDRAHAGSTIGSEELVGLVYGAANLWGEANDRRILKKVLEVGMDSPDRRVATAAMEWFLRAKRLELTPDTQPVLNAFVSGRALEAATTRAFVLDRLTDVIDQAPDLVHRACARLLDLFKADLGNPASGSALHSEELLSIALTLQRQEEPHRSRGLDLFEQLLHHNAYRARDVLLDIDRRPGSAVAPEDLRPMRRRRKRGRHKS